MPCFHVPSPVGVRALGDRSPGLSRRDGGVRRPDEQLSMHYSTRAASSPTERAAGGFTSATERTSMVGLTELIDSHAQRPVAADVHPTTAASSGGRTTVSTEWSAMDRARPRGARRAAALAPPASCRGGGGASQGSGLNRRSFRRVRGRRFALRGSPGRRVGGAPAGAPWRLWRATAPGAPRARPLWALAHVFVGVVGPEPVARGAGRRLSLLAMAVGRDSGRLGLALRAAFLAPERLASGVAPDECT